MCYSKIKKHLFYRCYTTEYTVNLVKNRINTAAMGGCRPPQPAQALLPPTQQDFILSLGTLYTTHLTLSSVLIPSVSVSLTLCTALCLHSVFLVFLLAVRAGGFPPALREGVYKKERLVTCWTKAILILTLL